MQKYTESQTIKVSKVQKQTLDRIGGYGYNVSQFIRDAINEKIIKDHPKAIPKRPRFIIPF